MSVIRPTTLIRAPRLAERLGVDLLIASETFQTTGSFKLRATYNLARKVKEDHLITASSGNYGQALAYAARLFGKKCQVVMPETSSRAKMEAVREFGGIVVPVDTSKKSRADRVAELMAEYPGAYFASAYDDDLVIEGNSSLAYELIERADPFDVLIAPVGGGGLSSGLVLGYRTAGVPMRIVGAEPLLGNDGARSMRDGKLVVNESEPQTIADGARTVSLGKRNWEILRGGLEGIVEVPEEAIREGVRMLYSYANLKAEPTGALSTGALLAERKRFEGQRVCCVVSGGNVDASLYANLISP